jgi:hypothetical protein
LSHDEANAMLATKGYFNAHAALYLDGGIMRGKIIKQKAQWHIECHFVND